MFSLLLLTLVDCSGENGNDGQTTSGTGQIDGNGGGGGGGPDDVPLEDIPSVPSGLGNGLVYDVRPMADAPVLGAMAVLPPAQWAKNVTVDASTFDPTGSYNMLRSRGFRIKQPVMVNALASDQGGDIEFSYKDMGLYVSDDSANFRTELSISLYHDGFAQNDFNDFKASHPLANEFGVRPTSIELFNVSQGSPDMPDQGHAVTWVLDGSPVAWRVRGLMQNVPPLEAMILEMANDDYRPLSISSRTISGGNLEYAALFVKDNIEPAQTEYSLLVAPADLDAEFATHLGNDRAPFYLSRAEVYAGGAPVTGSFTVLYIDTPEGLDVRYGSELTTAAFKQADIANREEGYHLVSSTPYPDRTVESLWAGVWHKYTSILRTVETPYDTVTYAEDKTVIWDHFDRRIVDLMSGAKASERAVPACTFAAFHGADVIYQKSYTYAPSIYAEAQHDDVYALASVSKSFTGMAMVKALDEAGLSLDDSLSGVLGWNAATFTPANRYFNIVTIRHALQQVGGIGSVPEYEDHEQLGAALAEIDPGLASYPISLAAYHRWARAAMAGEIQTSSLWSMNAVGKFKYSNPNFSLVGSALSNVVGNNFSSYQSYLEELIASAGRNTIRPLHETRLPLAGKYQVVRNLGSSYLTLDLHPYKRGATPVFDFSEVPYHAIASVDERSPWGPTVNGLDRGTSPRAPSVTGQGRYGGFTSMVGASLPSGGWEGTMIEALLFLRAFTPNDPNQLVDSQAAIEIWTPIYAIDNDRAFERSRYGLGVYLYENWMMAAGGTYGSMTLLAHNLEHDVSYAIGCNVLGNGFSEFLSGNDLDNFETDSQGVDLYPCVDWTITDHPKLASAHFDECTYFTAFPPQAG